VVRISDQVDSAEYRLRYASFTGSSFTLANSSFTAGAGTGSSEIYGASSSEFADDSIGDLVYASTFGSSNISYVETITGTSKVTIFPLITGMSSGYQTELNVLPIAVSSSQDYYAYVPLIDIHETAGSSGTPGNEQATVTYSSDIEARVRCRQAGDIIPYEADITISNTNITNNVIRTSDTIFS